MDAILRYILYHIAYSLLFFEIFMMIFFCVAIIVIKFITKWSTQKRKRIQSEISSIIEKALFSENSVQNLIIPPDKRQFRNIVETLERFDYRFNDERWREIKDKIVGTYLIPLTEKFGASYSWFKRQLAGRAFLLCPEKANKKLLENFLNDKRYLVRIAAASCITKISNHKLFYELLKKMSTETTLSQFPYRDALLQADQEKYEWLEDILSTETNPAIITICLDILSTRYSNKLLSIIKPFLKDSHRECRVLATKALGNIPSDEAIELLINGLQDSDWEIRAESIIGLQKTFATQAIPQLSELLNDPVWWVRLQAAIALKKFGEEGRRILKAQSSSEKPFAHEISQYILALP